MTTYAEECNYWKTGRSSADSWIDKAKKEITAVGGVIDGQGFMQDMQSGKAGYMLAFRFDNDPYRLVWPVLPVRTKNASSEEAARRQAATAMYHDVKAKCVAIKFRGAAVAFAGERLLPSGRTVAESTDSEILEHMPMLPSQSVVLLPPPQG